VNVRVVSHNFSLSLYAFRERKGIQTLLLEDEPPNEMAAFLRDAGAGQTHSNNPIAHTTTASSLFPISNARRDRARSHGDIEPKRFSINEVRSRPLHKAPTAATQPITAKRTRPERNTSAESYSSTVISTLVPQPTPRRKRTISFGGVLPTRSYRTEVVRSYKDDKSYQPETLSLLKTSSTTWFDVPYRSHSQGRGISRTSWSRASAAARITSTIF
jgi:hypothetical protein